MLKRALMATAITLAAASAHSQTVIYSQGFDNLTTSGWTLTNNSSPVGINWFQGDNTSAFSAQAGAANSYAAANFNSTTTDTGSIANWLISPTFSTAVAGTVSFYARGAGDEGFSDHIQFGLNTTGSTSTGSFTLGSMVTLTDGWTQYSLDFAALGAGSVARFAIEYVGVGIESNYVGVDSFAVTTVVTAPVPEPSTYALMALGIAAVAVARRRRAA